MNVFTNNGLILVWTYEGENRTSMEEIKQYVKGLARRIGKVPWPVWPIVFMFLLIFQNQMEEVLKAHPLVQWGFLLVTVLIGIIGIIRIQSK